MTGSGRWSARRTLSGSGFTAATRRYRGLQVTPGTRVAGRPISLGLLAARRISLRDSICFGPFMLGGALVAILVSGHAGFLDWQSDHRPEPARRSALAGKTCRGRSAAG